MPGISVPLGQMYVGFESSWYLYSLKKIQILFFTTTLSGTSESLAWEILQQIGFPNTNGSEKRPYCNEIVKRAIEAEICPFFELSPLELKPSCFCTDLCVEPGKDDFSEKCKLLAEIRSTEHGSITRNTIVYFESDQTKNSAYDCVGSKGDYHFCSVYDYDYDERHSFTNVVNFEVPNLESFIARWRAVVPEGGMWTLVGSNEVDVRENIEEYFRSENGVCRLGSFSGC